MATTVTFEELIESAVLSALEKHVASMPVMSEQRRFTDKPLLSVKQTAELLGLPVSNIYNWLHMAECPFLLMVGGRKWILTEKLFAWLNSGGGASSA